MELRVETGTDKGMDMERESGTEMKSETGEDEERKSRTHGTNHRRRKMRRGAAAGRVTIGGTLAQGIDWYTHGQSESEASNLYGTSVMGTRTQ
jgi:hypothetical protein